MGLSTIPAPVAGPTHNIQAFTSSQTWTVPASAKYVDVLVVGGGGGGRGGYRTNTNSELPGYGGGVTIVKDLFLGGTGTVSITVGAGTNGSAGVASSSVRASVPGVAGFSAFGTYVYSQGASQQETAGSPAYKGSSYGTSISRAADSTQSNYAPTGVWGRSSSTSFVHPFWSDGIQTNIFLSTNSFGFMGGMTDTYATTSTTANCCGAHPGQKSIGLNSIYTNTLPTLDFYNLNSLSILGTASAGTAGVGGAAAGAAGITGFGGSGGACVAGAGNIGGQGGAGAGGGGSYPNPVGGNGGNGGNAGTNTGSGGGGGANTGSGSAGTGGNGGNGASGIVVVHWVS